MQTNESAGKSLLPKQMQSEGRQHQAVKHDAGKPRLSLIPYEALCAEANAFGFGANKYGVNNWRGGLHYSRLLDAALRHIHAYGDGENLDPESGLSHLAHARACLGMLVAMPEDWDDRNAGR